MIDVLGTPGGSTSWEREGALENYPAKSGTKGEEGEP